MLACLQSVTMNNAWLGLLGVWEPLLSPDGPVRISLESPAPNNPNYTAFVPLIVLPPPPPFPAVLHRASFGCFTGTEVHGACLPAGGAGLRTATLAPHVHR